MGIALIPWLSLELGTLKSAVKWEISSGQPQLKGELKTEAAKKGKKNNHTHQGAKVMIV